jgi:hypothetical protein
VKDLQEFHNTNTKKQVEQARKQLLEELKQAKRDGDVDLEVELTDQLNQANAALTKPAVVPPIVPPAPQVDPDTVSWADANRWYGTDARKTSLANSIANGLRADPENDHLVGKAFYDLVDKELSFRLNGGVGSSKVGSGNHSGDGGNTKGRAPTYNDLDPDAKRICDTEGKKFVGEGKLYKTQAEWRQYYANAVLGV